MKHIHNNQEGPFILPANRFIPTCFLTIKTRVLYNSSKAFDWVWHTRLSTPYYLSDFNRKYSLSREENTGQLL